MLLFTKTTDWDCSQTQDIVLVQKQDIVLVQKQDIALVQKQDMFLHSITRHMFSYSGIYKCLFFLFFETSQNGVCLAGNSFPHPVGVFCTHLEPPKSHIGKQKNFGNMHILCYVCRICIPYNLNFVLKKHAQMPHPGHLEGPALLKMNTKDL